MTTVQSRLLNQIVPLPSHHYVVDDNGNLLTIEIGNMRLPLTGRHMIFENSSSCKLNWEEDGDICIHGDEYFQTRMLKYLDIPTQKAILKMVAEAMSALPYEINRIELGLRDHVREHHITWGSYKHYLSSTKSAYLKKIVDQVGYYPDIYPWSVKELIQYCMGDAGSSAVTIMGYGFCAENPILFGLYWYAIASELRLPLSHIAFDNILKDPAHPSHIRLKEALAYNDIHSDYPGYKLHEVNSAQELMARFLPTIEETLRYHIARQTMLGHMIPMGDYTLINTQRFCTLDGGLMYDHPNVGNTYTVTQNVMQLAETPGLLSNPIQLATLPEFMSYAKKARAIETAMRYFYTKLHNTQLNLKETELLDWQTRALEIPAPQVFEYHNEYSW
jgi:hypothetical protein